MARLALLRRRPAFRRLFIGETVSQLGDWMSWVALSLLAVQEGGGEGAMALALVLVAHTLPAAVLAPWAGVLADRLDRRRLLVGTHWVQGALTLGMAGAAAVGSLGWVQILLVLRASLGAVAWSARSGALQASVAPEELLEANALSAAAWSVTFAAGMSLGGIVALAGPVPALVVDGATYALAAVLLAELPALPGGAAAGSGLLEAVRFARAHDGLRAAVLAKAPLAVAGGGALVLLGLMAGAMGAAAAVGLGFLQAIKGVATGVGPLLAEGSVARGRSSASALAWADGGAMAGMVALGLLPGPAGAVGSVAIWGLGSGANWVLSSARLQQLAPSHLVGRLSAVDGLAVTLGTTLGALGAGGLVELTGVWLAALAPAMVAVPLRMAIHVRSPDPRGDEVARGGDAGGPVVA